MLEKVSVFFILVGLLFLICPLYAQDTQTDVALELVELKERIQELEKGEMWLKVQVGSAIALVIVTIGLVVCTYALWRATNRYRIATEDMAKTQREVSAIQGKVLKVNRLNLFFLFRELAEKKLIKFDTGSGGQFNVTKVEEKLWWDIIESIEVEYKNNIEAEQ